MAAGGKQAPRHRPEQLVPDRLSPPCHLEAGLLVVHPFLVASSSTFAVQAALRFRDLSSDDLCKFRVKMRSAIINLANATSCEDAKFLVNVPKILGAVLKAYLLKNIAFMREI